jgi:hypothetical protein
MRDYVLVGNFLKLSSMYVEEIVIYNWIIGPRVVGGGGELCTVDIVILALFPPLASPDELVMQGHAVKESN